MKIDKMINRKLPKYRDVRMLLLHYIFDSIQSSNSKANRLTERNIQAREHNYIKEMKLNGKKEQW